MGKGMGFIMLTVTVQAHIHNPVEVQQGIIGKQDRLLIIMQFMLKVMLVMEFMQEHYQQVMAV